VLNVSIYWKALACEIDYIYYFDTVVLKSCLIWIPFTGVNMKISVGLSGRSNVASPLYRPGNHNVCQLECNSLHSLLYQRLGESSAGVGGSEQLAWPRSGVICGSSGGKHTHISRRTRKDARVLDNVKAILTDENVVTETDIRHDILNLESLVEELKRLSQYERKVRPEVRNVL